MTRKFNSRVRCEACGSHTTEESPFERWMRGHPKLSSEAGIVRFDIDILVHRYLHLQDGKGCRDIQAMMFVEIKTHMAVATMAQRDTLYLLNQVLRNRKPNIHSTPKYQASNAPVEVYSLANRRNVRLRLFGGHLLQLDGVSPEDSSAMYWDKEHRITATELVELLRFERDPDNPTKMMDWRRRSEPFSQIKRLFD